MSKKPRKNICSLFLPARMLADKQARHDREARLRFNDVPDLDVPSLIGQYANAGRSFSPPLPQGGNFFSAM